MNNGNKFFKGKPFFDPDSPRVPQTQRPFRSRLHARSGSFRRLFVHHGPPLRAKDRCDRRNDPHNHKFWIFLLIQYSRADWIEMHGPLRTERIRFIHKKPVSTSSADFYDSHRQFYPDFVRGETARVDPPRALHGLLCELPRNFNDPLQVSRKLQRNHERRSHESKAIRFFCENDTNLEYSLHFCFDSGHGLSKERMHRLRARFLFESDFRGFLSRKAIAGSILSGDFFHTESERNRLQLQGEFQIHFHYLRCNFGRDVRIRNQLVHGRLHEQRTRYRDMAVLRKLCDSVISSGGGNELGLQDFFQNHSRKIQRGNLFSLSLQPHQILPNMLFDYGNRFLLAFGLYSAFVYE